MKPTKASIRLFYYQGSTLKFDKPGKYDIGVFFRSNFNDIASSLTVAPGWAVKKLCYDADFHRCNHALINTGKHPRFGSINDQVSSVIVTGPAPKPAPKPIPQITYCRRSAFHLHDSPAAPVGWRIKATRVRNVDYRFIPIVNSGAHSVYIGGRYSQVQAGSIERWFHSFRFGPYTFQFVDSSQGRLGPKKYCTYNTPIDLDIDGSGAVETIAESFQIDITGDGDIETLNEWFAPTEGILIDTTYGIENGIITCHHLLFGTLLSTTGDMGGLYRDGFAKLLNHDDDSDGDAEGAELDGFAIWTDSNSNARLDDGMCTLASHAIVALSTFHDEFVSTATLDDGSKMYMEDLFVAINRR